MAYILSIDQGTTSSRAFVFDQRGSMTGVARKEFRQIFPKPGWVEHDPKEIWSSQLQVIRDTLVDAGIGAGELAGIGITNQRETALVWDRQTGEPVYNAIVWQDRRTSAMCDSLKSLGYADMIRSKTGLVIDSYFSATKWQWILDNIPEARQKAARGELAFGTVDSWLIWNLTGGKIHVTDATNASRTMLFNIHTMKWDQELLELFDIPPTVLPEVRSSSEVYGMTDRALLDEEVPIAGVAGDQQAATFGQMCLEKGSVKSTYGTGCFILCNTGQEPVVSRNNLVTTIAWQMNGVTTYALEGSIFIGGAVIQWLRDSLKLIDRSDQVEELARSEPDNGGVYFVPAFTGLGAPHWDQYARGLIGGLTRGTTAGHLARAALESIAFQVFDVIQAMEDDAGITINELKVDGGAVVNNLLMQFQADLIGIPVTRPEIIETTAMGAAYLAGLALGYWSSLDEISRHWKADRTFRKAISEESRNALMHGWQKAIERARCWE